MRKLKMNRLKMNKLKMKMKMKPAKLYELLESFANLGCIFAEIISTHSSLGKTAKTSFFVFQSPEKCSSFLGLKGTCFCPAIF